MARGGRRPGAGRPKGTKEPKTLEKEAAREALRARVFAQLVPLVDAQIANAQGIKYVVARNKKTGKFERVGKEGVEGILERAEKGEELEIIEVWEKDPSVQAFTDLMNRAIDKPAEQVDLNANVSGSLNIVERLAAGRKRVADARGK